MMVKDIVLDGNVIGKKYGVVISNGINNESDCNAVDIPTVIKDGGVYKMWYTGSDGTNHRIHYATSTDGKTWIKHGIVLELGTDGESDDFHTDSPSVIYDGKIYHMWYGGYDCCRRRIHHATSVDGVNWKKHGVVIDIGVVGDTNTFDNVFSATYSTSVIYDGNIYKMWYGGHDGSTYKIQYATSTDGKVWVKHGEVLAPGKVCDTDSDDIDTPSVIFDGEVYHMWYSGFDEDNWRIHYATSTDGIHWDKRGVVLSLGSEGDSDNEDISAHTVIKDGDVYKVWYTGYNGENTSLNFAEISAIKLNKIYI